MLPPNHSLLKRGSVTLPPDTERRSRGAPRSLGNSNGTSRERCAPPGYKTFELGSVTLPRCTERRIGGAARSLGFRTIERGERHAPPVFLSVYPPNSIIAQRGGQSKRSGSTDIPIPGLM